MFYPFERSVLLRPSPPLPLEGARSAPVARASGWTLIVGLNAAGPLAASGARGVAAAQGSKRLRNEARVTTPLPPKGLEQAETGDRPSHARSGSPWRPGPLGPRPLVLPMGTLDPGPTNSSRMNLWIVHHPHLGPALLPEMAYRRRYRSRGRTYRRYRRAGFGRARRSAMMQIAGMSQ